MVHHRENFQRLYDLRQRSAPPELDYAAPEEEAESYFARKDIAFIGLIRQNGFASSLSYSIQRKLSRSEAQAWLDRLARHGEVSPIEVEGDKEVRYALSSDLPLLKILEAGEVPAAWQPLGATNLDEVIFLAPLDIVSARGRAGWLFDFEYLWEVYKPADKRRWGYYTLPVLYGDRLVARLDPRLERATKTLHINGFWLDDHAPVNDPEFATALGRGLGCFARFLDADQVQMIAIEPTVLRAQVAEFLGLPATI
jgi:uncharacterized protein YcaQ